MLGIVVGFVISKIYEPEISFEKKYKKLIDEFYEPVIIVFILSYIVIPISFGGLMYGITETSFLGIPVFAMLFVISMAMLPIMMGVLVGDDPKPEEILYHLLLGTRLNSMK